VTLPVPLQACCTNVASGYGHRYGVFLRQLSGRFVTRDCHEPKLPGLLSTNKTQQPMNQTSSSSQELRADYHDTTLNLGHGQQTIRPVRQPEIPGNLYLRPLSTELKTCNQTSVRLTPCYTILSHLDGFVPNRIACETDGIHFTVKCAVRFMHGSVRARARVTSPCGHVRECILCSHLHDKTLTQCDVDALASE
jgi:hypothetical protein